MGMWLLSVAKEIWGPSTEWRRDYVYPWRTVTSIDGTELWGHVMRRTIKGRRQYRAMSADEGRERLGSDVI